MKNGWLSNLEEKENLSTKRRLNVLQLLFISAVSNMWVKSAKH